MMIEGQIIKRNIFLGYLFVGSFFYRKDLKIDNLLNKLEWTFAVLYGMVFKVNY